MSNETESVVRDAWVRQLNRWQRFLHIITFGMAFGSPSSHRLVRVDEPGPDTIAMGDGPERTVHYRVEFEARQSALRGSLSRVRESISEFWNRRDVQVTFRVAIMLALILSAIHTALFIWGGGVPHSTLRYGDVALTLSRSWDVLALLPLTVIFSVAIRVIGKTNDEVCSESEGYYAFTFISSIIYGIVGLVCLPMISYASDGVGAVSVAISSAYISVVLGLLAGLVTRLAYPGSWTPIALTLAVFSLISAIAMLTLGIGSGLAFGLVATVGTILAYAIGVVGAYVLTSIVISPARLVGRFFCSVAHWLAATDKAE